MHYLKLSEALLFVNMIMLNAISIFINAPVSYLVILNLLCIYILILMLVGPDIYNKWRPKIIFMGFVVYLYTGSDIIINHKQSVLGLAYILVGMTSGFILSKLHIGSPKKIEHP